MGAYFIKSDKSAGEFWLDVCAMKPPRSRLSICLAGIITFITAATMLSTAAASTSEVIGFVLIVGVFMFIGLVILNLYQAEVLPDEVSAWQVCGNARMAE
jgi:hypothetical protein